MESQEELTESVQYNKQEFIEELDVIQNELKKLEEKALKLKLETALMALELSTRIQTPESLKAFQLCQQKAEEIQIQFKSENNESENDKKFKSESNEDKLDVIFIDDSESQVAIDVKPNH